LALRQSEGVIVHLSRSAVKQVEDFGCGQVAFSYQSFEEGLPVGGDRGHETDATGGERMSRRWQPGDIPMSWLSAGHSQHALLNSPRIVRILAWFLA
jgi:hypothetical protein